MTVGDGDAFGFVRDVCVSPTIREIVLVGKTVREKGNRIFCIVWNVLVHQLTKEMFSDACCCIFLTIEKRYSVCGATEILWTTVLSYDLMELERPAGAYSGEDESVNNQYIRTTRSHVD